MRTGPDQTEEDRHSSTSVQAYGDLWEKSLEELWEDTSVTIRDIASKLGVNELTVKRRAINLKLTYPRNTPRSLRSCGVVLGRYRIVRKSLHETLEERRQELLSIMKANPQANRTELQSMANYLLGWLRNNDSEWLEAKLPPTQKNLPEPVRVDWESKDIKLAEAVKKAALEIISIAGRPARASLSEIIKKVSHRAWIERDLDKLPKTDEALEECKEPFEDFLLRKIEWTTDCYLKESVVPSRNQFMTRSGLFGRAAAKSDRVRKAIDEALAKLSA
jgi:hypothetical protein